MKLRSCSVLIILAVLSAATSGHFFGVPVRAAPTPQLFVAPQSQPLANPGSTVTFSVNVSGIGMDHSLAGWEIYVRDDNSGLSPVDFTGSSSLGPGFEGAHCVNNVGTLCSANDAVPGTVHSAFSLFGPVLGNITLFTITYKAIAG